MTQKAGSCLSLHLNDKAKSYFKFLERQKEAIEKELGYPLEWEELSSRRDSRISSYLTNIDVEDESDWPRQHEWLASRLNDLHRVFARRVAALDPDALTAESDERDNDPRS